jgi:hypothetical protein
MESDLILALIFFSINDVTFLLLLEQRGPSSQQHNQEIKVIILK